MFSFKFGHKEVASKDFHKQRQITDILTIDVNKVMVSDKVSCNNGKDWWYIAVYQVDGETIMLLFIETPKNLFSYETSQYDKSSAYTISFNVSEILAWVLQYKNIWNEVESQLFEKMVTEPMKGESKHVHGKLRTWKERIKINFHGQDISCNRYCNATALSEIDSVYKKSKNYHHQVYVE